MGRHWNLFDPFSLDDGPALRRRQKLFLVLVGGAVSFLTALIVTFGQRSARQVEQHLLVDAQSVLTRDFPQIRLNFH